MSFTDQHALKSLPAQIAKLERDVASLHQQLADSTLFQRDPARFTALTAQLAEAQSSLTDCEDRWLDLELRRAESENAA